MDVSASDVGGHSDFGVKEIQVKLRCSPGGQTGFALFDRRERGEHQDLQAFYLRQTSRGAVLNASDGIGAHCIEVLSMSLSELPNNSSKSLWSS